MSVILVVGIPHGGTTILRKIIGNIEGVYDYIEEVDAIMGVNVDKFTSMIPSTHRAIVIKSPFTPTNITTYNDPRLKIVYVIKNPYDVYGSYRTRFGSEDHYTKYYTDRYGIGKYECLAKLWLKINSEGSSNIFTVKYEDLFSDDYAKIKQLVKWLGFEWSDSIIASERTAGHQHIKPGAKPPVVNTGANNASYRYYQINSELRDMTGESASNIYPNTKRLLDNMQILKDLDYLKYSP